MNHRGDDVADLYHPDNLIKTVFTHNGYEYETVLTLADIQDICGVHCEDLHALQGRGAYGASALCSNSISSLNTLQQDIDNPSEEEDEAEEEEEDVEISEDEDFIEAEFAEVSDEDEEEEEEDTEDEEAAKIPQPVSKKETKPVRRKRRDKKEQAS